MEDDQIVKQLNTNLLGVIRVTQAFIPYFREKNNGTFISTTSTGGMIAFPLGSTYHATKWALEGWSESLAFELDYQDYLLDYRLKLVETYLKYSSIRLSEIVYELQFSDENHLSKLFKKYRGVTPG